MPVIRYWSTALVGLALAGIIHIVALQLIPLLTPQLARQRLAALGGEVQFHSIGPEARTPDLDPAFRYAVCLFDLGKGPVAFDVAPGGNYWGLSFHDRRGGVFYAINNRSTELGRITLILASPQEAPRLSRMLEERSSPHVVVETPVQRGYAMMKVMVPSPSLTAAAIERLGRAHCRSFEPPPSPDAGDPNRNLPPPAPIPRPVRERQTSGNARGSS